MRPKSIATVVVLLSGVDPRLSIPSLASVTMASVRRGDDFGDGPPHKCCLANTETPPGDHDFCRFHARR